MDLAGPTVKVLRVRFRFELARRDLGAFRGALVSHVGRSFDKFHNHAPGANNYMYRYPLVQYRIEGRQAALIAFGEGVDDLRRLLDGPAPELWLHQRRVSLIVDDVAIDYYPLSASDSLLHYEVRDYLPLSQQNEREFRQLDEYTRGDWMGRLLTNHLLAFAQGVGWRIEQRVRVELAGVRNLGTIRYKGAARPAFDVRFRTNLELPYGLGLGKAVAMGFGVTHPYRPT